MKKIWLYKLMSGYWALCLLLLFFLILPLNTTSAEEIIFYNDVSNDSYLAVPGGVLFQATVGNITKIDLNLYYADNVYSPLTDNGQIQICQVSSLSDLSCDSDTFNYYFTLQNGTATYYTAHTITLATPYETTIGNYYKVNYTETFAPGSPRIWLGVTTAGTTGYPTYEAGNIFDSYSLSGAIYTTEAETATLTIDELQYNPVTGNVFLAGQCVKYGSGQYQMTLDGTTNFSTSTLSWTSIDPLRKSLVHCLDNGTYTALYNGSDLTGTTTLVLDDSFYGTEIVTADVNFYAPTGYISYNWGDLVSISTLNASGTPVSLPFIYDVCGDPDYNATSSYIYLATDSPGANDEIIHTLNSTSPKVQIDTCSGATHIDFTMPYNSLFEGEAYFAYANTYDVIILESDPFYIFARPQALEDGSDVYFTSSSDTDMCTPPDYSITSICEGIPETTLGEIQCGFKYALVSAGQFLFYPSCNSRQYITDQFFKFKGAFPFNTYFDLTGTMQTAITSAQNSTTTSQGLSIPFIRNTGTTTEYYMMSVATSTSFSNLIGTSNYNTYLLTIGFIYWIIVAGVIFFIILKV